MNMSETQPRERLDRGRTLSQGVTKATRPPARPTKGMTRQQRSATRVHQLRGWEPSRGMDRLDAYGDLTIVSALLAGASLTFVFDGNLDDPTSTESVAMVLGTLVASINLCGTIVIVAHIHTAKRLASYNPYADTETRDKERSFQAASVYLMETARTRGVVVSGIIWSVPLFLFALGVQVFSKETETGGIAASIAAAVIAAVTGLITIVMLCFHRQANKFALLTDNDGNGDGDDGDGSDDNARPNAMTDSFGFN